MISRSAFYGMLILAGLTGAAGDILLAHWAKVKSPDLDGRWTGRVGASCLSCSHC